MRHQNDFDIASWQTPFDREKNQIFRLLNLGKIIWVHLAGGGGGDQGMFTLNKCTALKGILILPLAFWLKCLGEKKFKFSNSWIWARPSGQVNSLGTLGGRRRRWSGNKHRCAFDQFPADWSSIDWRWWWSWWGWSMIDAYGGDDQSDCWKIAIKV